jgi:Polycystin cation channel
LPVWPNFYILVVTTVVCLYVAVFSSDYWGEVGWYGGGGYVANLAQSDCNNTNNVILSLVGNNWLDRR